MSFVTLHQSQSQSNAAAVTETSEGAAVPTNDRDDAQSFLEAVYRSQLINGLVEAFRFGQSNVMNCYVMANNDDPLQGRTDRTCRRVAWHLP